MRMRIASLSPALVLSLSLSLQRACGFIEEDEVELADGTGTLRGLRQTPDVKAIDKLQSRATYVLMGVRKKGTQATRGERERARESGRERETHMCVHACMLACLLACARV